MGGRLADGESGAIFALRDQESPADAFPVESEFNNAPDDCTAAPPFEAVMPAILLSSAQRPQPFEKWA